jgi:acyl-homoserine lactone acylase PvdQ
MGEARLRFWTALIIAAAIAACAPAPPPPAVAYHPTITRNEYGVPSVHGATDAEAAYGLAYAHAEDNFETIQLVILAGRGRLGAHSGRSWRARRFSLASDRRAKAPSMPATSAIFRRNFVRSLKRTPLA